MTSLRRNPRLLDRTRFFRVRGSQIAVVATLVFSFAAGGRALPRTQADPSAPDVKAKPKAAPSDDSKVSGGAPSSAAARTPEQKQLADDSARLLVLANELKIELDKSSKDTLSLTVIKKAAEVEKLAHKVREEMKKSMGVP